VSIFDDEIEKYKLYMSSKMTITYEDRKENGHVIE